MAPSNPVKLATIECPVCTVLMDVLQQEKPEPILIWGQHRGEPDLCQHPPLMKCSQARAEVALRYGGDARPVAVTCATLVGLARNKSPDRRRDETPRRRPDRRETRTKIWVKT